MADIVGIVPGRVVSEAGQINEGVVAALREALQRAEDGFLVAVQVSGVRSDGGFYVDNCWGNGESALPLLGALEYGKGDLIADLQGSVA